MFVLLSFKTNFKMIILSLSLDFQNLALSRSSISMISLPMHLMAHEYVLYVTFVTSNIVLRHPNYDASKNVLTPTVSEFDEIRHLARFRETIPTVKSFLSSEIQRINFGFLT